MRAHRNTAPLVAAQASGFEVELFGGADPANGVEHHIADDFLAAGQQHPHPLAQVIPDRRHGFDGLAQPQGHAVLPELVGQHVGDLVIDEFEEAGPLVNEGHAHAQRSEHAGVLAADDAAADDGDRARQVTQVQNIVADDDALAVEGNAGVAGGAGAHRHHDNPGRHVAPAVAVAAYVAQPDSVRPHEGGLGVDGLDAVAVKLVAHHVQLVRHDAAGPQE